MARADVDDTTGCPVAAECEWCSGFRPDPGSSRREYWVGRGEGLVLPGRGRDGRCRGIPRRHGDLYVVTADSGMAGVLCLTLCAECRKRPLPAMGVLVAAIRVTEHCEHLGIDLDQMAILAASGRA